MVKIISIDKISKEIDDKMQKSLTAYEASQGIVVNYKCFTLLMLDEQDEAIGVLNAYTAYAEIYIEDLWIDSPHRGKGYGTQLIHDLEQRFKNKGFNNINLVTGEVYAPGFYQK